MTVRPDSVFGGANELENLVEVGEGFAGPVIADLAEQAVLDGIPLGSARWVMTDGDLDAERIDQLLL